MTYGTFAWYDHVKSLTMSTWIHAQLQRM